MPKQSSKILSYFLETSGESFKVALGIRANEKQLQFYRQSAENQAFNCLSKASQQFKSVSTSAPKTPDPKEIIEKGTVVLRGIQEAIKLAGQSATSSFSPKKSYDIKDSNEPPGTVAPKTRPKSESLKLPREKRINIKLPEKQELSEKARESKVPASRIARMASFGGM